VDTHRLTVRWRRRRWLRCSMACPGAE